MQHRLLTQELGIERNSQLQQQQQQQQQQDNPSKRRRINPVALSESCLALNDDFTNQNIVEKKPNNQLRICFQIADAWTVTREYVQYINKENKSTDGFEGITIAKWYTAKDTGMKKSVTQSFGTKTIPSLDRALTCFMKQKAKYRNEHFLNGEDFDIRAFVNESLSKETPQGPVYNLSSINCEVEWNEGSVIKLQNDYVVYIGQSPWLRRRDPNCPLDHLIIQKEQEFLDENAIRTASDSSYWSNSSTSSATVTPTTNHQFQFAIPLKYLDTLYIAIHAIAKYVYNNNCKK